MSNIAELVVALEAAINDGRRFELAWPGGPNSAALRDGAIVTVTPMRRAPRRGERVLCHRGGRLSIWDVIAIGPDKAVLCGAPAGRIVGWIPRNEVIGTADITNR